MLFVATKAVEFIPWTVAAQTINRANFVKYKLKKEGTLWL